MSKQQTKRPEFICIYHPKEGLDPKAVTGIAKSIEQRVRSTFSMNNDVYFYIEAADREGPTLISPLGIIKGEYHINEFLSAWEKGYVKNQ